MEEFGTIFVKLQHPELDSGFPFTSAVGQPTNNYTGKSLRKFVKTKVLHYWAWSSPFLYVIGVYIQEKQHCIKKILSLIDLCYLDSRHLNFCQKVFFQCILLCLDLHEEKKILSKKNTLYIRSWKLQLKFNIVLCMEALYMKILSWLRFKVNQVNRVQ